MHEHDAKLTSCAYVVTLLWKRPKRIDLYNTPVHAGLCRYLSPRALRRLAGGAEIAHARKLQRIAAASEEAVKGAACMVIAVLRSGAAEETAALESARRSCATWLRGKVRAWQGFV